MGKYYLWFFSGILFFSAALADETLDLDEVIVTATRNPASADNILAPTVLIDRDEIERSHANDVAELLRFHAGIEIGRNGGAGQATSIFLRGTESNHTLVLIDGVEINPGTLGGAPIQNIPVHAIERIEIVKGPRSSLYGSEAIGGVINIITRDAEPGLQARARIGAGSFSTRRIAGGIHRSTEKFRVSVNAEFFDTAGFPTRQGSNDDRGHDNRNLNFSIGSKFSGTDIEFRHWQAEGNTEFSGFSLEPRDQDYINRATAVEIDSQVNDMWKSGVLLSNIKNDLDQNQQNFLGDLDFVTTDRDVLDWQNDIALGESNLLTAGIYLSRENTESLSFGTTFDVDTDVDAIYLQDAFNVGRHRLVAALRHTDHEISGTETTWNVDYGFDVNPRLRVIAAAGTAFRAPDSTDLFGFGGNSGLRPETARNLELGVLFKLSNSQRIRVNVFDTEIDDLIAIDFSQFPSTAFNIDQANIRGIEIDHELTTGTWGIKNSVVIQDTEDELTGESLPRRADRSLSSLVTKSFGAHELGIKLLATSERRDSPFSSIRNGGYLLVNLQGSYRINESWLLSGRVENLLDRDYHTAAGFNNADRSVFVSIGYTMR